MADCVVLASGSGSNFAAIAGHPAMAPHRIRALISDNPRAYALVRAEQLQIPSVVIDYGAGRRRAEARLARLLDSLDPALVVLAGFMKVLRAEIVDRFPDRIVNLHPALLPSYPGLHAIERSFADPRERMGITIHLVDAGVDTGPVLARYEAHRDGSETLDEMEERIHALEHTYYPRVIADRLASIGLSTNSPESE